MIIKLPSLQLFDPYNRHLNYLRISITDRCNLRCIYCNPKIESQKLHHNDILRYEEILRIVRIGVAMGITKVRVTGGEPLVRKGCYDFLSQLARIEGLEDLALTTNGVLLKNNIDRIIDAGVRRLNISLDTLNRKKYEYITGEDAFDQVWQGIMAAHQKGINPIKLNVVVLSGINDEELVDFARLSIEYPFHIRFIEFMPVGPETGCQAERYLPGDQILTRLQTLGALEPLNGQGLDGPARRWKYSGARGEIGLISPISHHFCPSCNRLRLTADGKLRTCIFSDDETDLREALRQGATDGQLEDIIQQAIARKPKEHPHQNAPVPGRCRRQMSKIGG